MTFNACNSRVCAAVLNGTAACKQAQGATVQVILWFTGIIEWYSGT